MEENFFNVNQMFSNETIFKAICEMCKQFDNIKDEDEYREKCIQAVYNTFNVDIYDAEILFDLALYWEWLYLANNDAETEFNIVHNKNWTFTATEKDYSWCYAKSYVFKKLPVKLVLKCVNDIAQKEFN